MFEPLSVFFMIASGLSGLALGMVMENRFGKIINPELIVIQQDLSAIKARLFPVAPPYVVPASTVSK